MIRLREMSAIIGLGLVGMLVCGILLNYLNNPIWISVIVGSIITIGLVTLGFYFIFLFEFVQVTIENKTIKSLEEELKRIRKL